MYRKTDIDKILEYRHTDSLIDKLMYVNSFRKNIY